MRIVPIVCIAVASCDTIGYGYVNQLRRPVTIVHYVDGHTERFTLTAGQRRLPRLHDFCGSWEEFLDVNGKQIASITAKEIDKLRPKDIPAVLVLSSSGVALATTEYWD